MKLSFHKNHRLLFGVVFFGFIGLSLIIAVGPAFWVQDHNKPIPGSKPMTKLQKEGLRVYVDEGCEYCHTQQVRPLPEDKVWGRPSTPGDYAHIHEINTFQEPPNVLGTERTGPDLTNVGKRRASKIWNYIHLYNPRSVVKESVMPAFHQEPLRITHWQPTPTATCIWPIRTALTATKLRSKSLMAPIGRPSVVPIFHQVMWGPPPW